MAAVKNHLVRPALLTEKVLDALRGELRDGRAGASEVLRSERELAKRFKVGRITVRRALKRLVGDGYLVNQPRRGYSVTVRAGAAMPGGVIAYVMGTSSGPWQWTEFMNRLERDFRQAASAAGRDLLIVARGNDTAANLAKRLAAQNIAGAIVDSDNPDVAAELKAAGVAVVGVDTAHEGIDSVSQDNFGGAYRATSRLIERGHRRIALLGFAPYGRDFLHARERTGGYLAALAAAGLPAPAEWRIFLPEEKSPGEALVRLASAQGGPTAAAVLWPEVFDDVGRALAGSGTKLDLVAWWGAVPERRERWAGDFPQLAVPEGMAWSTADMARLALEHLEALLAGGNSGRPASRSLVPVRLLPGGEGR
ncbi:MAG TPA: GntR family transcriptional regulator [Planctomycetota bacterium]|nr:GntR family transcriptional regulator [Planctomycetota bacterium]